MASRITDYSIVDSTSACSGWEAYSIFNRILHTVQQPKLPLDSSKGNGLIDLRRSEIRCYQMRFSVYWLRSNLTASEKPVFAYGVIHI